MVILAGGFIPAGVNTIDKFPFAVDSNATDVGDTTELSHWCRWSLFFYSWLFGGFGPSNN
jgi:hypothetical protein